MKTNLQLGLEAQREIYGHLKKPMLAQICEIHRLTIRDLASIFGISKNTANAVIVQKQFPSLVLAFRLARYFECSVEDLWGWMLDDDGIRRPLVVEAGGQLIRLKSQDRSHDVLALVKQVAEAMRGEEEK